MARIAPSEGSDADDTLGYACNALDKYDLSKVRSLNDAVKYVAGQTNHPPTKIRSLLQSLQELKERPTVVGGVRLSADTVCSVS